MRVQLQNMGVDTMSRIKGLWGFQEWTGFIIGLVLVTLIILGFYFITIKTDDTVEENKNSSYTIQTYTSTTQEYDNFGKCVIDISADVEVTEKIINECCTCNGNMCNCEFSSPIYEWVSDEIPNQNNQPKKSSKLIPGVI